ncbi:MAG: sulfatase-like hydrolase/transferase [Planctomycetota bacterium]
MNKFPRRDFLKMVGLGTAAFSLPGWSNVAESGEQPPNIVYIIADDMGYGDVGCLNQEGKIPTPHMDKLASEGMIFTDAHSGSAVCTPTRYGVLTGRYSWRSRMKAGVLFGYSPPLLEKGRITVASLLKDHGYTTACIGKWHLGWTWQTLDGEKVITSGAKTGSNVDYSKPIIDGPVDAGFDYFFGISGSLDMTPYVYVENDRVTELPTETIEMKEGMAFFRGGPIAPGFKHEEVLPHCTDKAVDFIDRHAGSNREKPFFLYFPLSAPHTPILPTEEFQGKTKLGPYGDFVSQCDYTVGRIMQALERHELKDNTLLIVTSDNGCSPMADFEHLESQGHDPSYIFRGYKADIFEGGHRIPFIVRWPDKVRAGTTCHDTVCLTDLMATAAEIVGAKLPDNAGEDSVSLLPDLFATAEGPIREAVVHHSINGFFSIRQGRWKLELCPGSGGWSEPRPEKAAMLGLPMMQLYDLQRDPGEQRNLQDQFPEVVHRMINLLQGYVDRGRSTPGAPQKNDGDPDIWKALSLRRFKARVSKVSHLAVNKPVRLLNDVPVEYSDYHMSVLTDGIRATSFYRDGYWIGIEGEDLEAMVDLGKVEKISHVGIGFLEDHNAWIFLPEHVEFSLSRDGTTFQPGEKVAVKKPDKMRSVVTRDISQQFESASARFIKVKAASIKTCPEWHKGAGGKAWLFADEIIVK